LDQLSFDTKDFGITVESSILSVESQRIFESVAGETVPVALSVALARLNGMPPWQILPTPKTSMRE